MLVVTISCFLIDSDNISFSDWAITQVIKPTDTSNSLEIGNTAVAIDEEIAAVGSNSTVQKVFLYDISVNPAKEIAILTSPDGTGDDQFGHNVAVSREYGILVGAYLHDVGGNLISWISCYVKGCISSMSEQPSRKPGCPDFGTTTSSTLD